MRQCLFVLILPLVFMAACGDDNPTRPTSVARPPVAAPADPTAESLSIFGPPEFTDSLELEVGATVQLRADIEWSDGTTQEDVEAEWRSSNATVATISETGLVTGRQPGLVNLSATAEGITARVRDVRVIPAPGPRTSFGSGTWIVTDEIESGRYFTNPSRSCYWERLSGLSGDLSDILANEFIGFDSGQEIVDIQRTDHAFSTDAECETWRQTPGPSPGIDIPPGRWLVGRQVRAGEYETTASDGCYWERLRGFSGNLSDVLDNDFVGSGGRQRVRIRSSDVGFYSDDDCGTWTPQSGGASLHSHEHQGGTIEQNRRLYETKRRD